MDTQETTNVVNTRKYPVYVRVDDTLIAKILSKDRSLDLSVDVDGLYAVAIVEGEQDVEKLLSSGLPLSEGDFNDAVNIIVDKFKLNFGSSFEDLKG